MTLKAGNPAFVDKHESWMNEKAHDLFKRGKSISYVCAELDISRETFYRWKDDKDHAFSPIARKGELLSQKHWEDIGECGITGELEKFSGSPWMFVMKNRFREHYSDQQKEKEGNTAVEMLLNLLVEKNK